MSRKSDDIREQLPLPVPLPCLADMIALDPTFLSTRGRGDDLHLLHCHRLSHVAETGQLKPRSSRASPSSSIASTPIREHYPTRFFQKIPPSPSIDTFKRDPFETPDLSPATTPDSSPLITPREKDAFGGALPEIRDHSPTEVDSHMAMNEYPVGIQFGLAVPINLTEQPHRPSVLRKVNSGFEVRFPGSLSGPADNDTETPRLESEKRRSKKLQKKNRQSAEA